MLLIAVLAIGTPAMAQSAGAGEKQTPPKAEETRKEADQDKDTAQDDEDLSINPAQPDFTIVALPTTLRMPRHKSAFRVTHRFTRPLTSGSLGDLASDLFGLDSSAFIGLEYRFGIIRGGQIGIYRTADKTIQFFAQYSAVQQSDRVPVSIDALLTFEGTNNFKDSYSPAIGAVVSRTFVEKVAVYAIPTWVNNSARLPSELVDDNSSFMLGLGARLRVRPTVYLVAEITPRLAGHDPDVNQASFGIEKRLGGHSFQLNFSNGLGTTMAQIARGGGANDIWYLGFNISRKFF